jgi:hypothetical protein
MNQARPRNESPGIAAAMGKAGNIRPPTGDIVGKKEEKLNYHY